MEDIIKKIQRMPLSRTDVKIADYVAEHINTIGLLTSTSLASEVGVSDTSVIRFIRKLGFRGYADFRGAMANRIADQYDQEQRASLLPGEKYNRTRSNLRKDRLIGDVSAYTFKNLEKSYSMLDNKTVDMVVQILLNSRRKYIAGFRGTASCAQYMANRLVLLVPNVVSLLHADASAVEALVDIEKEDCLFLYSFPRYSELNYQLIEIARKNSAKIILMTDRYTSPLSGKADITLLAQIDGLGFTNSYVAPLSLSEVILLALSGSPSCAARIVHMDKIVSASALY